MWHDDQQGTATVLLAALQNALVIVGKRLSDCKVAMTGMGAANVATYRLLNARGLDPSDVIACDSRGTLHARRHDIEENYRAVPEKWQVFERLTHHPTVNPELNRHSLYRSDSVLVLAA